MRELGENKLVDEYDDAVDNEVVFDEDIQEEDTVQAEKRRMEYDEKTSNVSSKGETTKHISTSIAWLESFLNFIDKFGLKKILQGCLLIAMFLAADFAFNAIHNEKMIEAIASRVEKKKNVLDSEDMKIRKEVGPKISKQLVKLLYSVGADRAIIFENHNGKENATALPFVYFDMTYEEIEENKIHNYISECFVNLNISYFKIPYHLVKKTFFIGNVEEMREIDNRFANRMEEVGCKYIGLIIIKSNGVNVGMLGVMFNNELPEDMKMDIHSELTETVLEISPLLDLGIQREQE